MSEKNTIEQVGQNLHNISQSNGSSHHHRRRRRKSKSKIKKYFEWLVWAIVITVFLSTIFMLLKEVSKQDDNIIKGKKKASIENYHFITAIV